MLRVVIIDDSPVARDLLREIFDHEEDIEVVGLACNGREGVDLVIKLRPDVVTMDVQMPRMDGYAATREIMSTCPTPIVVVSGSMDSPDVEKSMESLRAGALTVLGKPGSPSSAAFDKSARTLVETIRTMADVKVIHRPRSEKITSHADELTTSTLSHEPRVVAIAASTGGPPALRTLLSLLPADFPLPILLVQHISRGFLEGFVSWLNDSLPFSVVIATDGEKMRKGTIYVAPEDRHLGVERGGKIKLSDQAPMGGFRPAATALFESVARIYARQVVACLLTGMGRDGVEGLKSVRACDGVIMAQSEESCVVYGMPAAAIEAGLVDHIDSLEGIAQSLTELVMPKSK